MNKTRWISCLFVFALALAGATAASADTACFNWSCHNSGNCSFDAGCSSATPFIWKYKWIYGDGTSSGLTGQSNPSHNYGPNGPSYPTVTFWIYPWSNNFTSVTCQIVVRNHVGPALPQNGQCSSSSSSSSLQNQSQQSQNRDSLIGEPQWAHAAAHTEESMASDFTH